MNCRGWGLGIRGWGEAASYAGVTSGYSPTPNRQPLTPGG